MYFSGGLIPQYLLIARTLNLTNSYASMVLPVGINIMYMLIMRSYFQNLPQEVEESAKIDGANDFVILFKIILPLSLPMLATITLYYAVDRWNEWWFGMLFIRSADKMPLQLQIRNIIQSSQVLTESLPATIFPNTFGMGIQMATIMTSVIPIMLLYPFLQRYFVKGLTLGAVKS
jgi:putative aldouronate transport system permease protein